MVSVPILWPSPSQKTSGKHDEKESLVWEHCPARSGFSSLSSAAIDYHRAISNVFQIPHVRLAMTHMTIVAKSPHGLQVEPHSSHLQKPFPAEPAARWSPRNGTLPSFFCLSESSAQARCLVKRTQFNTVHYSSVQFSTVRYIVHHKSSQICTLDPTTNCFSRLYELWSAFFPQNASCNPTAPAEDRCCPHAKTRLFNRQTWYSSEMSVFFQL